MVTRRRAAIYSRRRQRRIAKVVHDLAESQWEALVQAWGGCAYCGAVAGRLQKDCMMMPISRGGRYTVTNVVPACPTCSASKGNLEVTTWMRRKGFDEGAFLIRQVQIAGSVGVQAPSANPPRRP